MDKFVTNRWAKEAIEGWKSASPKRTFVLFAQLMNEIAPGTVRTKQYINKIKQVPKGGKPQDLTPEDIQAIEAITGVPAPLLVITPTGGDRDMVRRAALLVLASSDDVLERAGMTRDEWAELTEGVRPFTRALAERLSIAAQVPPEFVMDDDWDCLPPNVYKKMAKVAAQTISI